MELATTTPPSAAPTALSVPPAVSAPPLRRSQAVPGSTGAPTLARLPDASAGAPRPERSTTAAPSTQPVPGVALARPAVQRSVVDAAPTPVASAPTPASAVATVQRSEGETDDAAGARGLVSSLVALFQEQADEPEVQELLAVMGEAQSGSGGEPAPAGAATGEQDADGGAPGADSGASSTAGEAAPATPAAQGSREEMDALADRVYERIRWQLRRELTLDRERRGSLMDRSW